MDQWSSESDGSHEEQRSLGGNDEASSLHLVEVHGKLLEQFERQQRLVHVDVVQLVNAHLITLNSDRPYPQVFCGLFVSIFINGILFTVAPSPRKDNPNTLALFSRFVLLSLYFV